jgi:tRNA nucleotidyltransferase (CCA-adding enzyme)
LIDLRQGIVRVLHSLSFVDDPTRSLRAVRFEQRFGFKIEQRTLELLFEALPLLTRVSGDRIRHEMNHVLAEAQVTKMLARLDELGMLKAIHPDLIWDEWLRSRIEAIACSVPESGWGLNDIDRISLKRDLSYIIWLIRLPAGQARSVISRLKFSAELGKTILSARQLWVDIFTLEGLLPSDCVDHLKDLPLLAVYAVYLSTSSDSLRDLLLMYVTKWKNIQLTINGHELRALGLPPGPEYRHVLETLRKAWLDGEITSEEEERNLLRILLEGYNVNLQSGEGRQ